MTVHAMAAELLAARNNTITQDAAGAKFIATIDQMTAEFHRLLEVRHVDPRHPHVAGIFLAVHRVCNDARGVFGNDAWELVVNCLAYAAAETIIQRGAPSDPA